MRELEEFRDTVLDKAAIRSGDVFVDAGTGTGLLALAATERVGENGDVIAIDISVDCLEQVRAIASASNLFYLIGTADVLPLPDEYADVVCTRSVLIYVLDKAEAAREFFRVLRPGGRVSLFEPINRRRRHVSEAVDFGDLSPLVEAWEREVDARPDDPMLNFDEQDLERFFVEAGFADVYLDVRRGESEQLAESWLTVVGAPGRKAVLQVWQERFSTDDFEALARVVRAQDTLRLACPQIYLTARKP